MAYDEGLAERLREILADEPGASEKKMFGGLVFMLRGHMCCGVAGDELMARVGAPAWEAALARPHAREMDFTGRSMTGFVYVATGGIEADEHLAGWVTRCREFVDTLPTK